MLQTQGMVVAVEDVKMRIGNMRSNVKTMIISSHQNGNNNFLLTNGTTTHIAKAPSEKQKKVIIAQSGPPILLLPKMSEIPALEPFLNYLRHRHRPLLLLQNHHPRLLTMKML